MKVIVEQCSRSELLEYIRFLKKINAELITANMVIRKEAQEHFGARLHLEDTIHELGCALDHVNDILNVYHISTLGTPDDEK